MITLNMIKVTIDTGATAVFTKDREGAWYCQYMPEGLPRYACNSIADNLNLVSDDIEVLSKGEGE